MTSNKKPAMSGEEKQFAKLVIKDLGGDEITLSIGTVVAWIDADKKCLCFKPETIVELANFILKATNKSISGDAPKESQTAEDWLNNNCKIDDWDRLEDTLKDSLWTNNAIKYMQQYATYQHEKTVAAVVKILEEQKKAILDLIKDDVNSPMFDGYACANMELGIVLKKIKQLKA